MYQTHKKDIFMKLCTLQYYTEMVRSTIE